MNNPILHTFHLVNYRLTQKSWKDIGEGLGRAKNLRKFTCQACNLYDGRNLEMLLKSMVTCKSLECLDLSDNDLSDRHSEIILSLIKHTGESRDEQMFWTSLRQDIAEKYIKKHEKITTKEQ